MKIFKLPDLGEGLTEAEIHEWHIKEGDVVKVDQLIASVETAKAIVEVPSPCAGVILKLHGKPGDVIMTGGPLVEFAEGEEAPRTDSGTVAGKLQVGHTILEEHPMGVVSAPRDTSSSLKA